MNDEIIRPYPLHWPSGWRRTAQRTRAQFGTRQRSAYLQQLTVADSVGRVLAQLDAMGVYRDDVVVSTDLRVRLDGFPMSKQAEPADPGAAVYWRDGDRTRCMAIDRYDRIADNIAAVAATLEAMRAIERHGGGEILERAFAGFEALPNPQQWWHVMGFASTEDLDEEAITRRYRGLATQRHPDRGGSEHAMQELNWARAEGLDFVREGAA